METIPTGDSFIEWYGKLWSVAGGDDEAAVVAAEKRLETRLPELLRAVYLKTSMRDSQMLHLSELNDLAVESGVLVFAREQQGSWSWGIPISRVTQANPPLVANPHGKWEDDDCTLDDFLTFYALTNRPYEPPFIDQSSYNQVLLKGPWRRHAIQWKTIQHAIWTNGEAVLEEEIGNLGARDAAALKRAASSLEIDEDEVDEALGN